MSLSSSASSVFVPSLSGSAARISSSSSGAKNGQLGRFSVAGSQQSGSEEGGPLYPKRLQKQQRFYGEHEEQSTSNEEWDDLGAEVQDGKHHAHQYNNLGPLVAIEEIGFPLGELAEEEHLGVEVQQEIVVVSPNPSAHGGGEGANVQTGGTEGQQAAFDVHSPDSQPVLDQTSTVVHHAQAEGGAGFVSGAGAQGAQAHKGAVDPLTDGAQLLNKSYLDYLAHHIAPETPSDLAISTVFSVGVIFLSVLAIKSGVHEVKEAKELKKLIKEHIKVLEGHKDFGRQNAKNILKTLEGVAEASDAYTQNLKDYFVLTSTDLTLQQRLSILSYAFAMAHFDQGIATSSTIAASGVALKGLSDLTNVILTSATGGFEFSALLSQGVLNSTTVTATAVFAGLSSVVFAPIAATGALSFGAYQVAKSAKQEKRWHKAKRLLQSTVLSSVVPEENSYLDFVQKKVRGRAKFAKVFRDWNIGFLTGASLYTAGAFTKACLVVLAAVGVTALVTPVGLGLAIGLTIAGGITMALCSHQFFHMAQKQKRYDSYVTADDPWIDRDCLSGLDLYGNNEIPLGLQLREACYNALTTQNTLSQKLLQDIAQKVEKRYTWKSHSAQKERIGYMIRSRSGAEKILKNLRARVKADWAGLQTLQVGAGVKEAWKERKEEYALRREKLSVVAVREWFERDENWTKQRDHMMAVLISQRGYLENKEMVLTSLDAGVSEEVSEAFGSVFARQAHDVALDTEILSVLDELNKSTDAINDTVIERFLSIQDGKIYNAQEAQASSPEKPVADRFARWLVKGQNKRYQDQRGILIETEIQAAHLLQGRRAYEQKIAEKQNSLKNIEEIVIGAFDEESGIGSSESLDVGSFEQTTSSTSF